MNEGDFAFLREVLRRRSGLALGPEKRYLVESRLAPIARAAALAGLPELIAKLRVGTDEALAQSVVDAMATHETLFFRDKIPFDQLRDPVLPRLAASLPPGRPLRIWSAAASTGQEAYSLAILLREQPRLFAGRPVEILATDISAGAIERARAGIYSQFEVQRGLPIRTLLDNFRQTEAGWEIRADLRRMVQFRVFNLLDDFTTLGRFDVVLCRNLLIYLDRPTKQRLLKKLAAALTPEGVLCLGGAESALGLCDALAPDPAVLGYYQPARPEAPKRPVLVQGMAQPGVPRPVPGPFS
jgi:chemotaxis protein methyltransferase CheR